MYLFWRHDMLRRSRNEASAIRGGVPSLNDLDNKSCPGNVVSSNEETPKAKS